MKIAVAVSGGVDSLYALWSLHMKGKEEGFEVLALHGRFLEEALDLSILQTHCDNWQIPLHIVDFRNEFQEKVVTPFIIAHKELLTPNPCVFCNRDVKFGILLDKALELGASYIATGHYVNTIQNPYNSNLLENRNSSKLHFTEDFENSDKVLQVASDNTKDQSYFLALVPKKSLQRAIFPLANLKKEYIREILAKENIAVPIPKESQEICFVPNTKHTEFILESAKKKNIELPKEGKIKIIPSEHDTEEEHKIFKKQKHRHKGLWHYTEGQRKGLGISWKSSLYVVKRDKEANILYLGTKEHLDENSCSAHSANIFVSYNNWKNNNNLFVRTRFRQKMLPAFVEFDEERNIFHIKFKEDECIVAAGQILAIYDETNTLLAGAILS